ncbi:hypothetical protein J22TS3_17730 [Paenibacillus sp. J22TS3]|nr:hypothetical protein J22TS3_17730 [Paenibacillus sp. J22TS3]
MTGYRPYIILVGIKSGTASDHWGYKMTDRYGCTVQRIVEGNFVHFFTYSIDDMPGEGVQ